MSFTVRIGADLVAVEAGSTVPLSVEVANRADERDQYELSVEGVDPEWVAMPVPTFYVEPTEVQAEKVFLKPPRSSESMAGTYPFVVRVRSLVTGESRTAQGVISIKPYHHLSMEISPKKGVISPLRKENSFDVTLMNLGNTEHTVQLFGTDPEDVLTFDFELDQVTLGPGQTKVVNVTPKPVRNRPISGSQLHGISISGRSTQTPSVVCTAQAQLEQRPLLSPGMLAVGMVFLAVFALWFFLLPKPPGVDSLSLDPSEPTRGQPMTVSWRASHADSVQVFLNGKPLVESMEMAGSKEVVVSEGGTVEAIAFRAGKRGRSTQRYFAVREPEKVPDPRIEAFEITPKSLNLGQSFLVKYKVNDAVIKATLSPPGDPLDLNINQIKLTADIIGQIDYVLVAENAAGKVDRRSIKVTISQASKAAIIKFEATPRALPMGGGQVVVTWQASNASLVELIQGDGEPMQLEAISGTREIFVDTSTELTLKVYDDQGLTVLKRIKVDVATSEVPPNPPSTTTGGASTAGGRR